MKKWLRPALGSLAITLGLMAAAAVGPTTTPAIANPGSVQLAEGSGPLPTFFGEIVYGAEVRPYDPPPWWAWDNGPPPPDPGFCAQVSPDGGLVQVSIGPPFAWLRWIDDWSAEWVVPV